MRRLITVSTLAAALATLPAASVLAQNAVTEVVGGLHSPRGLAIGPGGQLFVAQAGDATEAGSIIEVVNPMSRHPNVRTVVSGLPSVGDEGEFVGVDGISLLGNGVNGAIYGIMALSPQATGNAAFGRLFRVNMRGETETLANVGRVDFQWTADHSYLWQEFPDANPYGVLATPGHIYVTDAGANTLDEVLPDGTVQVLAYFPNTTLRDAVPTCVTKGPDGMLYVGTLALVDNFVFGHAATVYRVDPARTNPSDLSRVLSVATPWATGLWPINGCTFGADGNFYASQLFTNPDFTDPQGDVVKIPFTSPATHTFMTGGALAFPAGVAVGPNGTVFVSDGAAFVPAGRVVRITP